MLMNIIRSTQDQDAAGRSKK